MRTGRFITLEGGEGSGKTTQIRLLQSAFAAAGISALATREPGGSDSAEQIRDLLVRGEGGRWDDISELLLFYAARREHAIKRVVPALQAGEYVICDRFADSSLVYQGYGKMLGAEYVRALHRLVLGNLAPDLTLWLDVEPETGLERTQGRKTGVGETRFEALSQSFHRRVHDGFQSLAKQEPERVARIDAQQAVEAVHADIIHVVNRRLGLNLRPQEA